LVSRDDRDTDLMEVSQCLDVEDVLRFQ
jgi:hypothetical protein